MFCLILFAQGNLSIKICQKGNNPGKHLSVQVSSRNTRKKVLSMFIVNNKDTKMTSLTS